jgi:hypothetical protein
VIADLIRSPYVELALSALALAIVGVGRALYALSQRVQRLEARLEADDLATSLVERYGPRGGDGA